MNFFLNHRMAKPTLHWLKYSTGAEMKKRSLLFILRFHISGTGRGLIKTCCLILAVP